MTSAPKIEIGSRPTGFQGTGGSYFVPVNESRLGYICALSAHGMWGILPLYWHMLSQVSSWELVGHRIVWSFVILACGVPALARRGQLGGWQALTSALVTPRYWLIYSLAGLMITINWLAFIYAATHQRILDASLGYYINPLLNVLIGVMVLRERLSWQQWLAVSLAACGVAVMTWGSGGLPWPAVAMATSFAVYSFIKKQAPLPALVGMLLEMIAVVIPTLGMLALLWRNDLVHFGTSWSVSALMVCGGVVTVVPLVLFATAARRIALSTNGVLQYVGPTLQLLVAVLITGEPFAQYRLVGFGFVWAGIFIFLLRLKRDLRVVNHS